MNGKAIRQAAREQINGRRGFLLLAVVLSSLPNWFFTQIIPRLGFEVPKAVSWPVSVLCALFSLGFIKIVLEQAENAPKFYGSLLFPFRRGVFLNALILTLGLNLFSIFMDTVTTGMGTAGIVVNLVVAFLLELLFFFIRYCFVLDPAHSLSGCIQKGLGLGVHWCGDVFVFNLCLYGPIFLAYVAFLVLVVLLGGSLLIIFILFLLMIAGLIGLLWYLPYAALAQAMFAKALILDEEQASPPPPPKKHMKLVKKDGWCHVNTATGKGGKNLLSKKDGEAIER